MSGASDITAEAAGVVYLGRSLDRLPELFAVSRRAVAIAWQNIIVFAGIVNVVAIGLGATGVMGPLGAAFTHQIASFLVMLNSLRLLRNPQATPWWQRLVWQVMRNPVTPTRCSGRRGFDRDMGVHYSTGITPVSIFALCVLPGHRAFAKVRIREKNHAAQMSC